MELPQDPALSFPLPAAPASTPAVVGVGGALQPASAALDSLGGSGQKATPASTAALPLAAAYHPATWLAATPHLPPVVPDAPVVTINDRRVRLGVPGAAEQPSLYRLCRQWVQNEPELGEVHEPIPTSKLPPLPPVSAEAAAVLQRPAPQEPPLPAAAEGSSDSEPPAVDALLQHHKQHWAAVQQHKKEQAAAQQQRYAQRLQSVVAFSGSTGAGAALGGAVPMQQ